MSKLGCELCKHFYECDNTGYYNECLPEQNSFELKNDIETARKLWENFGDVPIGFDNDRIEEDWMQFPKGTDRFEIWKWFESYFNISIAKDLEGYEEGGKS